MTAEMMTIGRRAFLALFSLAIGHSQIPGAPPPLERILGRMAIARAENRIGLRSYRVTRSYQLFGQENSPAKASVTAELTFIPPDVKTFVIRESRGVGLAERIVRQMLEHEVDMVKNYDSTDLTRNNYDFRYERRDEFKGRAAYVLQMVPLRKDKTLLSGLVWVDAATYRVVRTEGKPGKTPSWWLRDSSIVLEYGEVGGMWLQIASESAANARFVGRHKLVSRDVEYKFGGLDADSKLR